MRDGVSTPASAAADACHSRVYQLITLLVVCGRATAGCIFMSSILSATHFPELGNKKTTSSSFTLLLLVLLQFYLRGQ